MHVLVLILNKLKYKNRKTVAERISLCLESKSIMVALF